MIDGKKKIILNPAEQQRRDVASTTFGENEVYGIDILVVSGGDGKACIHSAYKFLVLILDFTEPCGGLAIDHLSARF